MPACVCRRPSLVLRINLLLHLNRGLLLLIRVVTLYGRPLSGLFLFNDFLKQLKKFRCTFGVKYSGALAVLTNDSLYFRTLNLPGKCCEVASLDYASFWQHKVGIGCGRKSE